MTLDQHNQAREFQSRMDSHFALKFAQALPHVDREIDFDALHSFEVWQSFIHPDMSDALDFLRKVVDADQSPTLVRALTGMESSREAVLCGL